MPRRNSNFPLSTPHNGSSETNVDQETNGEEISKQDDILKSCSSKNTLGCNHDVGVKMDDFEEEKVPEKYFTLQHDRNREVIKHRNTRNNNSSKYNQENENIIWIRKIEQLQKQINVLSTALLQIQPELKTMLQKEFNEISPGEMI